MAQALYKQPILHDSPRKTDRSSPSEAEHLTKAQQGLSPQTKQKRGKGLPQALNAVDPEKNMSGLQKRLLEVWG